MGSITEITQKIKALKTLSKTDELQKVDVLLSDVDTNPDFSGNVALVVRMMQSTIRYLIAKKEYAHPKAIPLVKLLGQELENITSTDSRSGDSADAIVERSIRSFKSLKEAIASASLISTSELEELKAVILSIDWEISTQTLGSFDHAITRFKDKVKFNKLYFTFLRILHSIGAYIAKNGSESDNESITLLQSVFLDFEQLVLNPDMSGSDKKEMIQANIDAYKTFKQRVIDYKPARTLTSDPDKPEPIVADEDIQPALAHINGSVVSDGQDTLSVLFDSPEDNTAPLVARQSQAKREHRDVMGDLFSPKTSPADELLDAIHLAELHGTQPESSMGMMGAGQEQDSRDGVKNFVPQRSVSKPIPEIDSRLDEFFNLDVSESALSEMPPEPSDNDPLPVQPDTEPEPVPAAQTVPEPADDQWDDISAEKESDLFSRSVLAGEDDSFGELDPFDASIPDEDDEDIAPSLSGFLDKDTAPVHRFGMDLKAEDDTEFQDVAALQEDAAFQNAEDFFDPEDHQVLNESLSTTIEDDSLPDFVTGYTPGSEPDPQLEMLADEDIELISPAAEQASIAPDTKDEADPQPIVADTQEYSVVQDIQTADLELTTLTSLLTEPSKLSEQDHLDLAAKEIASLIQLCDDSDPRDDRRQLLELLSALVSYVNEKNQDNKDNEHDGDDEIEQPLVIEVLDSDLAEDIDSDSEARLPEDLDPDIVSDSDLEEDGFVPEEEPADPKDPGASSDTGIWGKIKSKFGK